MVAYESFDCSNLDDLHKEIDTLINDGMKAIETMSFASYEVNARRRECIKPDLNEDSRKCAY